MNKLVIKDLSHHTEQERVVLNDINYEFYSDRSYAIIDKDLVGKVAFISFLSGIDVASDGQVLYNDQLLTSNNVSEYRAKKCSVIYQRPNVINTLSVLENIQIAMKISEISPREYDIITLLLKVDLEPKVRFKYPNQLSELELYKFSLALVFAKKPQMIIADDPTSQLSCEYIDEFLEILLRMTKEINSCLIIVTKANYIATKCDVVLGLSYGEINNIKGQ